MPEIEMTSPVKPSGVESYHLFIRSRPVAVVHFWADWNLYDVEMSETLAELASAFAGQVGFGSINVDREEMRNVCLGAGVLNIPALAYYRHGTHIETRIGVESKEMIAERIRGLIASTEE
jgi:thioredoxin-like negative regulator of GroEL